MTRSYEIGGVHVRMTEAAAARWNAGVATDRDLRSRVFLPCPQNQYRELTLRRALNRKLEPEVARQLHGMPANQIGD
jgi:hypothetical protein